MRSRTLLALLSLAVGSSFLAFRMLDGASPASAVNVAGDAESLPSQLAVVWTDGDRNVALKVAFMYTFNAKARGWFDEVTLIVWGPSANLLAEDPELQESIGEMRAEGIEVVACKACADSYGVSETLAGLGIDVKYMGQPLTEMLKGDWKVLTF